jgi:hypothetical protein
MNIFFPIFNEEWKTTIHRYYFSHISYMMNIFKFMNYDIKFYKQLENVHVIHKTKFDMFIDDKRILIDFSDHYDILENTYDFDHYFKFHYNEKLHKKFNINPITPISFHDWNLFYTIKKLKAKKDSSKKIWYKQIPHAAALERRTYVKELLINNIDNLDTSITDQESFFKSIDKCKASIHVPGAREDMLDRAQLQLMGFGIPTISPKLNSWLSYNIKPIANIHYIECKNDYSDLVEIIKNLDDLFLLSISNNSLLLFEETSTPEKQINYILQTFNNE